MVHCMGLVSSVVSCPYIYTHLHHTLQMTEIGISVCPRTYVAR